MNSFEYTDGLIRGRILTLWQNDV